MKEWRLPLSSTLNHSPGILSISPNVKTCSQSSLVSFQFFKKIYRSNENYIGPSLHQSPSFWHRMLVLTKKIIWISALFHNRSQARWTFYWYLAMKSHYPESRISCHRWTPKEENVNAAKTTTIRHPRKLLINDSKELHSYLNMERCFYQSLNLQKWHILPTFAKRSW